MLDRHFFKTLLIVTHNLLLCMCLSFGGRQIIRIKFLYLNYLQSLKYIIILKITNISGHKDLTFTQQSCSTDNTCLIDNNIAVYI